MQVKAFRALRPRADLADKIASYPYDVVSSAEARELAADDRYSFLHVVRPEIDLDPSTDPTDDSVYLKGRANLAAMIEKGWLQRDEKPAYYIYRLTMGEHTQYGIVAASAVDDYLEDRIKKHEFTRPAKENDRVRLNQALAAHPGPVLLTYHALPEINALVRGEVASAPEVEFTASDGIGHAIWVVDDPATCSKFEGLFSRVRATYVADGHHRAAAASRVSREHRDAHPEAGPDAGWNYFLTVLFPSDQLQVFDYNRVVTDLNGLTPEQLLERIKKADFDVEPDHRAKRPPHRRTIGMYLAGRWYLLTIRDAAEPKTSDVAAGLDVSILNRLIIEPILGVGDVRTDKRIDFVGGIRGMEELEKRVDSGRDEVAFALYPTSLEDVMSVADAGQVMPPKSTWFEPKLRSGLVIQQIGEDAL